MIASFLKSFVFVKTRKTAGTSVEIVLSGFCGPGDVVAPITPVDEIVRHSHGGGPRNFMEAAEVESRYAAAIAGGSVGEIDRILRAEIKPHARFWNHMPASAARERLPQEFWQRALKFTIERHPYEKAVSMAYWRGRKRLREDAGALPKLLDELIEKGRFRNFDLYTEGGRLIVDRVLQHATVWAELAEVGRQIGFQLPPNLPTAKGSHRQDRRPAREILTPDQKERIYRVCKEEFELFGYER